MRKKVLIIGGGLVGLSIAYKLGENAEYEIALHEKELKVGEHQSSRNSGVIHCGISYKHKTLKARLANDGYKQLVQFAKKHKINYELCGKLLVSNNKNDADYIKYLKENGALNGLKGLEILNKEEILKIEPYVDGVVGLKVPEEGIIDFKQVVRSLKEEIKNQGNKVYESSKFAGVTKLNNSKIAIFGNAKYEYDVLINCGGLYSDRIYEKVTGKVSPIKIIPFRGEYFKINNKKLVNNLIYPLPNPIYPFLGVHFTRLVDNTTEVGPNAVLSTHREGYNFRKFSLGDTLETLKYSGLRNFILKNPNFVMKEIKTSLIKSEFLKEASTLIPDLKIGDLGERRSGVRAQAIDKSGNLVQDFVIKQENDSIHVLNSPSPGATSCLAIADFVLTKFMS